MEVTINVTQQDIDEGICGDTRNCAIANALKRELNARGFPFKDLGVGGFMAVVGEDGRHYTSHTPDVARRFISLFDVRGKKHVQPFSFTVSLQERHIPNVKILMGQTFKTFYLDELTAYWPSPEEVAQKKAALENAMQEIVGKLDQEIVGAEQVSLDTETMTQFDAYTAAMNEIVAEFTEPGAADPYVEPHEYEPEDTDPDDLDDDEDPDDLEVARVLRQVEVESDLISDQEVSRALAGIAAVSYTGRSARWTPAPEMIGVGTTG